MSISIANKAKMCLDKLLALKIFCLKTCRHCTNLHFIRILSTIGLASPIVDKISHY